MHGQRWIRSERIAAEGNVYIHVLASLSKTSQVQGFEVSWFEWDSKALLVSAEYERLSGSAARVTRHQYTEGGERLATPIDRVLMVGSKDGSQIPIFFPLLRIFMGGVISSLLLEGGEAEVVIPSIVDPEDMDETLKPLVSVRCATPIADSITTPLGADVFCFEYVGDQYQAGSVFTFNRTGLLLEYRWQQSADQLWQIRLINLEGRDSVLGFDLDASSASGECDETV